MRGHVLTSLLIAALAFGPTVSATPMVVSESGENGFIPALTPATFHVVHMEDGAPAFHKNTHVRVLLDDDVVYETTPASGHEYDGIHTFTLMFPRAGTYTVQALEGETVLSAMSGTVTPTRHAPADAQHSLALRGTGYDAIWTNVSIPGMHTEGLLRIQDSAGTLVRTELHDHAAGIEATIGLANAEVGLTRALFQAGHGPTFEPFYTTSTTDLLTPSGPTFVAPAQHTARNAVTQVEGTNMVLVATYDPFTVVGPGTFSTIGLLAMTPDGALLPHTDFSAAWANGDGVLWATESGHEHDGIWEVTVRNNQLGTQNLRVTASNGDASADLVASWTVAIPADSQVGTYDVHLDGATTAWPGAANWLNYTISNQAGQPFAHGEMLVAVRDEAGVEVFQTKVHTHADGAFAFQYAFPAEGKFTVTVEPFSLSGSTATFTGALVSEFNVHGELAGISQGIRDDMDRLDSSGAGNAVMLLAAIVALVVVAVASLAFARRKE